MTKDEIIAMARQAGMSDAEYGPHCTPGMYAHNMEIIHRFAALVAARERKECAEHYIKIAREAIAFAKEEEREACAQVCDELANPSSTSYVGHGARTCATAIRARGKP